MKKWNKIITNIKGKKKEYNKSNKKEKRQYWRNRYWNL